MKIVDTHCPACNERFDHASDVLSGARPQPDDFSICVYCGAYLRFNSDFTSRQATPDDLVELNQGEDGARLLGQLMLARSIIAAYNKRRGRE